MTKVSLDIETYSECDLKSSGVHSYAEHPSTEVLCICYAFGDEPVQRWTPADLFIPDRLRQHIESGGVVSAFNAEFERTVLNGTAGAKIGFPRITIEQTRCSMVKARAHGLPGSLGDVAKALGTHEKSDTGRIVMLQLARPRKGKESRYTPENSPEKFEQLYVYCEGDVEAERAIDKVVPDLSASELALYHLDQHINLRGVLVDLESVANAQYLIDRYKEQLRAKCIEITGIAPSQTGKLAEWIRANGYPQLENLQAETVKTAVEDLKCPEKIRTVLRTYSTHGAKAVSKFSTLAEMACSDGRLRGLFRFYGANCVPGNTEVLTRSGWVRLDAWVGGEIAQVHPDEQRTISFLPAERHEGPVTEGWLQLKSAYLDCAFTNGHTFPTLSHHKDAWTVRPAAEVASKSEVHVPISGVLDAQGTLTADQVRVLVMVQADGSFETKSEQGLRLRISVKKLRKVQRVRELFAAAGVTFSEHVFPSKPGYVHFDVKGRDYPAWLSTDKKVFGPWLLDTSGVARRAFMEEIKYWDGFDNGGGTSYCSTIRTNVEWVCTVAHLCGLAARVGTKKPKGNRAVLYETTIRNRDWCLTSRSQWGPAEPQKAYCTKTQTGYWLARSAAGNIFITGNTGRWSSTGVQLQNLARGSIDDPDNAITAFSARDLDWVRTLYTGVDPMKVLASTVRGMLVAPKGKVLQSLDFSAIEARVCAWLLGEQWKLDAFKAYDEGTGPDLYKVAYARSFGVDVEVVTKQQRQIGKVMELALGYEGGVGAFVTMVGTYGVKLEELAESAFDILPADALESAEWMWDKFGKASELPRQQYLVCDALKYLWRQAHPNIHQGWKDLKIAAEQAVQHRGKAFAISTGKAMFKVVDRWLYMRLPNGRKLAYYNPRWIPERVVTEKNRFGQEVEKTIPGELRYWGVDTYTRRWMEVSTYGGRLAENLVQATSRDLLANGMLHLEHGGYPTVMTVHDEIVSEIPEDFDSFEHAGQLMCTLPKWATGLPVAVDGHRACRYKK